MNIAKRQKYKGQGRTISFSNKKIDINFDITVLNLMASYVISDNKNIKRSSLVNMRNLFDIIDETIYINDLEKKKRFDFIRKALEAKLVKNLKNPAIIIKDINGGILDDDIIDVNNFELLSNEEINWVDNQVSGALKYAFIYNDVDRMIDICTRFKASDYASRGVIVEEMEQFIIELQNKFRKVKSESISEMPFSLRSGYFEEVIKDIYDRVTDPSSILVTGMQGFNELLGGGFFGGRTYMLFGLTSVGKSLTLLDIAYQIKKMNKNFKPKDPTKIPVVLYITMENDVKETVQRLVSMSTNADMETCSSADEVINLLKTEGELFLTDASPIDIIVKYYPNRSIDTSYLYTIVEDLEDEGYEVICLIQDHVKRIKSAEHFPDIRQELGGVVNEFKTFAQIKQIPVISNSHLNRDGARTIDEGTGSNKSDLIRMLGRANIGESMLMLDNLDCSFIINLEYDKDGNKFMAFKRVKCRYKTSVRDLIMQPYLSGNLIKLVEDYYAQIPAFKESLRPSPTENNLYNNGIPSSNTRYMNGTIKNIDEILSKQKGNIIEDEDNIFSSTRYSSSKIQTIPEEDKIIPLTTEQISANAAANKPLKRIFRRVV